MSIEKNNTMAKTKSKVYIIKLVKVVPIAVVLVVGGFVAIMSFGFVLALWMRQL